MLRTSNSSFDLYVDGSMIHAGKASLKITDHSKVIKDHGIPNGYVEGSVEASGDIEVNDIGYAQLQEIARAAGSWDRLPLIDLTFYANIGKREEKIEAFACKLKIEDVVGMDSESDEAAMKKITFEVTGKEFVRLDGVPYLNKERSEKVVSVDEI